MATTEWPGSTRRTIYAKNMLTVGPCTWADTVSVLCCLLKDVNLYMYPLVIGKYTCVIIFDQSLSCFIYIYPLLYTNTFLFPGLLEDIVSSASKHIGKYLQDPASNSGKNSDRDRDSTSIGNGPAAAEGKLSCHSNVDFEDIYKYRLCPNPNIIAGATTTSSSSSSTSVVSFHAQHTSAIAVAIVVGSLRLLSTALLGLAPVQSAAVEEATGPINNCNSGSEVKNTGKNCTYVFFCVYSIHPRLYKLFRYISPHFLSLAVLPCVV